MPLSKLTLTQDVTTKRPQRRNKERLICLLTILLFGCTSEPEPKLPQTTLSRSFDGVEATPTSLPAAGIDWQEYITDSDLSKLITLALQKNHSLKVALLRVEEARATYGIVKADRTPTVNASGAVNRARIPGDISGLGEAITGNQFQLSVGISSWEADFWGRVRNLNEAALEGYLASDDNRRAATLSLIAQISKTYLSLRELDERIRIAQKTSETRKISLQLFRRRVELGATSPLELTQVELLSLQAETLISQLQQAREIEAHALSLIVGEEIILQPFADPVGTLIVFTELDTGLPSELLINRPDISAAEHNLRAANANILAARAAFFPRIALTASAGTASTELNGLFKDGSGTWNFSPSISVPIFDGGRLQSALDVASIRRDAAIAQYEQTIRASFRDVVDALSTKQWLREQMHSLDATANILKERCRQAKLRYDSGAARYLEVLDAERDLLNTSQELVKVRHAILSNQISLFTALGGGSNRLPEPPNVLPPIDPTL